jgi:hypothetical protein
LLSLLAAAEAAVGQSVALSSLPGVAVDDSSAKLVGEWKASTSVRPFVGDGYLHDDNSEKGAKSATFSVRAKTAGKHHVLLAYTTGGSRATNAPVAIEAGDATHNATLNQRQAPSLLGFADLGQFDLPADSDTVVTVSNEDTDGHVIVDALLIATPAEFDQLKKLSSTPSKVAKKPGDKPQPNEPPAEPAPKFQRVAAAGAKPLSLEQFDALLEERLGEVKDESIVRDELFLRRLTLDIVGRQPTAAELEAFLKNDSPAKRSEAVERLLASEDYGRNWANYWSDVIGSRQQEPELTFHDYTPFKEWLAGQFNGDSPWDAMVFEMLTASGPVGQNPAGTFIAFHQADANRLAGETSRVFLSVQIACAECHDHPFVDMPTETFHGMAAFFVRAEAKIPQNESRLIELKSKTKGEHKIPGRKGDMLPVALGSMEGGAEFEAGLPDRQRRATLAQWLVHPKNPFFARAYVNRVFARLMGRGFYEPVDEMGEMAGEPVFPEIHDRLAEHFVASGFDHKAVVRLLAGSRAYQRSIVSTANEDTPLAAAIPKKLRGDEVFDSLVTAIALPNIKPPKAKPTEAIRFPVPPKSTRDLVNEAFGYDPSFKDELLIRTMKQAMFMMNNEQLQAQINSDPMSDTFLAQLLVSESDDAKTIQKLYWTVLARSPSEQERKIVEQHIEKLNDRGAAYEDVLWSLINSAEFTTRR